MTERAAFFNCCPCIGHECKAKMVEMKMSPILSSNDHAKLQPD